MGSGLALILEKGPPGGDVPPGREEPDAWFRHLSRSSRTGDFGAPLDQVAAIEVRKAHGL
jgi:hypothetical protein